MFGYRTRHLSTDILDFSSAARALVSSVATGIGYDSGTGQISISTGYVIPTTTQETNWNAAYGWGDHSAAGYVPGTRTVAGHALSTDVTISATDVGLGNVTNDSQVKRSEMGAVSGVATLDAGGKLPTTQLPALAVVDYLGSVATEVAMLALTGERGDWCTRSDLSTIWVISGADPTQLASWTQLSYPTAPVTSVAGKTGAVTLAKADVGLGSVENTALSTWAGTTSIVTLGTIGTGVWQGTAIADSYIASAANWNAAYGWGDHSAAGYVEAISTNTTLYVATTGNDTTGDGSSDMPWATLNTAIAYLAYRWINSDVMVTIQLADGSYTATTQTLIQHPCGQQIRIVGTNTYTKSLSSIQSSSGSARGWSIVLNLSSVTGIAAGDYVIIQATSGGTNPTWLQGCWPITDVDVPNNRITITSYHSSATAPSGAVASSSVHVVKSVLQYNGCNGIHVTHAELGSIDQLVISGNLAAGTTGVLATYGGRTALGAKCGVCNFATGCAANYAGSFLNLYLSTVSGNTAYGLNIYNGNMVANSCVISGNGSRADGAVGIGVLMSIGSTYYAPLLVVSGNGGTGVAVTAGSQGTVGSSTIDSHITNLYSSTGAFVAADSCVIRNGSTYGVYATSGTHVDAALASFAGNGTDCSPAVNTVGNDNAYIKG